MTDKELVMNTIRWLPDNVTIHEISQELKFLVSIRKGADQILDRGERTRPRDAFRVVLNSRR